MKSKLEKLTAGEIEAITRKTRRKNNIPLLVSKPAQIFLDEELNSKLEVLSNAQGVATNKFVATLLKEDVDRLWKLYRKAV